MSSTQYLEKFYKFYSIILATMRSPIMLTDLLSQLTMLFKMVVSVFKYNE